MSVTTTVELCLASNPRLAFVYESPNNFTLPRLAKGYTYTIVGAVNLNTTPSNPPVNQTYNITNQYIHGSIAISFNTGMKYGAKPFRTYTTTTPLPLIYTTEPLSSLYAVQGWNNFLIETTITVDAECPLGVQQLTFDSPPPQQITQQFGQLEILAIPEPLPTAEFPTLKVVAIVGVLGVAGAAVYLLARKKRRRR